ncbi:MAG: oligosaccharide flippase family protein [Candidatus Moraniibacteriota bacterium]|nr:MAG: oligosaccharide flippase family protein [Candidatus Moranbacteria bacterium]
MAFISPMTSVKLQENLFRLAEIVHLRLFGHAMSDTMKGFLGNLSWSFSGGIFASIAMLFVNVLGGRYMGPEQYGLYGLVLAVSQIVMLPAVFGMDIAGLHFLSRSQKREDQSDNLTTTLIFVSFSSIVTVLSTFLVFFFFRQNFHFDAIFLVVTIVYSIALIFRSITDIFFRGLHLFKEQFFSRIAEVFLTVFSFVAIFFFLQEASYRSYVFVLFIGYIGFIIYGVGTFRTYFSKFRFSVLKHQLSYAWVVVLSSSLGVAFNVMDKIIIVQYLSIQELGIYMAYFTASTNLIAQATQMFVNVYFPAISRISDNLFIKKLDRVFLLGAAPIFLLLCLIIYFIMFLFGSQYGQSLVYIVSFGLLATLQIVLTVYSSTIMALSKDLYKKYVIIFNGINLVHLVGYFVLIFFERVSILALVYMFIANIGIAVFFQRRLIGKEKLGVYNDGVGIL